ncbi:MAG: FHA domain-containing protein [Planctomycetota bacterium]|jgi:hypothetical protein
MNEPLHFDDFKERFGGLDRSAFLQEFRSPFLVIQFGGADKALVEDGQTKGELPTWDRTSWETEGLQGGLQSVVFPVIKTDRNEESEVIIFGRAAENDVPIPHPSISKRHAYFRMDPETGSVTVEEAGSTYGTLLNGEPLVKEREVTIENRATFVFAGSALATFFDPPGLFEFLHPEENPE